VVTNLITLVKSQFDIWAKSVDELVAVTDADAAAQRQRAGSAARVAQGVQIGASVVALAIGVLAAWWITRNVTRPIRQAVSVAERVAHGDLSFTIPQGGRDETGALLEALAGMQTSLNALVTDVRDAASAIATASAEVAMGNNDLSQRTENAASHLQHTTHSIDQLSKAVHQSADSAQVADSLARGTAQAAAQGGSVASKAVQSMLEVATQSQRIGDIIGVIEGIAFQTNILALNAAIEAASAGEQGRGFAVVAGEVRNLAQRSATAAKDIAALIQTSMTSVEQGSRLVRDAGDRMEAIVGSVNKVTTAIEEISQTTTAQSEDLSRIGTAMCDIDRMTQQNAALVEQSAAAAESLKAQSQRLAQMVAMFRLKDEAREPVVNDLQH
jgi:methyl-accepting chemotaxis protein